MDLGVIRETTPGERRVAITPGAVPALVKAGCAVLIESGAGREAGYTDEEFSGKGAAIVADRNELCARASLLCQVRTFRGSADELRTIGPQTTIAGLADPLGDAQGLHALASTGARCFALELLPRITRAQSMDVLSSQATVAGYKAVVLAASASTRLFPMLMTAAGTVPAAKAFIIGAGVAGLQAIATAKRLGAVVNAYDVRPAVKEQVESLGAKFVQLDLASAEGAGGYAKAMGEASYAKQRELMAKVVAQSDIVITTAAVPGAAPPVLITQEMVKSMPAGAVIVDLAARQGAPGGNCELSKPDEIVRTPGNGVTIIAPTNLPATVPHAASQMYARNMASFVSLLLKDGQLNVDKKDEIIAQTLVCENGEIVNPRINERLGSK